MISRYRVLLVGLLAAAALAAFGYRSTMVLREAATAASADGSDRAPVDLDATLARMDQAGGRIAERTAALDQAERAVSKLETLALARRLAPASSTAPKQDVIETTAAEARAALEAGLPEDQARAKALQDLKALATFGTTTPAEKAEADGEAEEPEGGNIFVGYAAELVKLRDDFEASLADLEATTRKELAALETTLAALVKEEAKYLPPPPAEAEDEDDEEQAEAAPPPPERGKPVPNELATKLARTREAIRAKQTVLIEVNFGRALARDQVGAASVAIINRADGNVDEKRNARILDGQAAFEEKAGAIKRAIGDKKEGLKYFRLYLATRSYFARVINAKIRESIEKPSVLKANLAATGASGPDVEALRAEIAGPLKGIRETLDAARAGLTEERTALTASLAELSRSRQAALEEATFDPTPTIEAQRRLLGLAVGGVAIVTLLLTVFGGGARGDRSRAASTPEAQREKSKRSVDEPRSREGETSRRSLERGAESAAAIELRERLTEYRARLEQVEWATPHLRAGCGELGRLTRDLLDYAREVETAQARLLASPATAPGTALQGSTPETRCAEAAPPEAAGLDQVADMAEGIGRTASSGGEQARELFGSMAGIVQASEQIQSVVKEIDGIAFQTNLLALNASVEAARAGRHGKGFAVVAEEVRTLAARSAKAAKATSDLIESTFAQVRNGESVASKTANSLEAVGQEVEQLRAALAAIGPALDGLDGLGQGSTKFQTETRYEPDAGASSAEGPASYALSTSTDTAQRMVNRMRGIERGFQALTERLEAAARGEGDAR